LLSEAVVVEMRVEPTDSINFIALAGGQIFFRIQTPTSVE
jgi:hypothetical protein